jgi:hypothetical protein
MVTKMYAYSCIKTGNKENKNFSQLSQTETYQNIAKTFSSHMFHTVLEKNYSIKGFDESATVFVDVLMYRDTERYKLNRIIQASNPYDTVLFILDINVFGSAEEIKATYRKFKEYKIHILCPDHNRLSGLSEYSTCGYDFEPLSSRETNRAYALVNALTDADLKDNRGRPSTYSTDFEFSYWLYESYQIPEDIAILMAGQKKTAFHYKAVNYESSGVYENGMRRFAAKWSMESIPKRYMKLPSKFDELSARIENQNVPLEKIMDDICIDLHIPTVHPVTYQRFQLRQQLEKEGVSILKQFKNYNYDIIERLKKYKETSPSDVSSSFYENYLHNKI